MICVLSERLELTKQFEEVCASTGVAVSIINLNDPSVFTHLYHPNVIAVVADSQISALPDLGWYDLLASLGRRIPIVVVGSYISRNGSSLAALINAVSWLEDPTAEEILAVLDACGAIGLSRERLQRDQVPIYNPQIPLNMLRNHGALSILLIDAGSFRKIAIEYGNEVYHRVQDCFNQLLMDMWGSSGSFRSSDLLCRRTPHGNTYFVFLEQPRSTAALPAPGVLERLADRLLVRLINAFWREIFSEKSKRYLPECISVVPDLAIGYATALHNPCVDAVDHLDQLIDSSSEAARMQMRRIKDRHRELLQTLIHTPGLLTPHYQAVFSLPQLTKQSVLATYEQKSIAPISKLLYGFESLIRVRAAAAEAILHESGADMIDVKYMRPDVLFALGFASNVGLELDQECLHQAIQCSRGLPGYLLVNILPRNLYNVERLKHLLLDRQNIIFEVSETEAINNLELMLKVRESLGRMHMRIAADDFGRGYSGLEQIIKMKPDLIKLDRSLITDIQFDEPKQAFVSGLVRAAKISGSTVLAEGVEIWDEAEVLQTMGIDLIQGFLLHRPAPPQVILEDLEKNHKEIESAA